MLYRAYLGVLQGVRFIALLDLWKRLANEPGRKIFREKACEVSGPLRAAAQHGTKRASLRSRSDRLSDRLSLRQSLTTAKRGR